MDFGVRLLSCFLLSFSVPMETKVFAREHMNNWYSVESYLMSKMLAEAPCLLLGPTLFLFIAYYLTGQPMEGTRILQMVIICLLFTMFSQAFGMVAGALWEPAVRLPSFNSLMILFHPVFLSAWYFHRSSHFHSIVDLFRILCSAQRATVVLETDHLRIDLSFHIRGQYADHLRIGSAQVGLSCRIVLLQIAEKVFEIYAIGRGKLHIRCGHVVSVCAFDSVCGVLCAQV
jgi:ABC-2 type transporter